MSIYTFWALPWSFDYSAFLCQVHKISHYCSFLEFLWLSLNDYSSRWTLESVFKVSKKILLGFSLESHLIYRLILGGELDSSQFWVLLENDTWFPNCSSLCLNVPLCVCVYHKQILPVSCKVCFWVFYRVLLVLWLITWFLDTCLKQLPCGIECKLGAGLPF